MNRRPINYWIDVGLLIAFLVAFLSGVAKLPGLTRYFAFMYGVISGRALTRIHDLSGVLMGILVFAHLILHFRWIVAMTGRLFKGGK